MVSPPYCGSAISVMLCPARPLATPAPCRPEPVDTPSESASEKEHDEDNHQHPGEARGTIAIRVIAPAGQTSKQAHKDHDEQQQTHCALPPSGKRHALKPEQVPQ